MATKKVTLNELRSLVKELIKEEKYLKEEAIITRSSDCNKNLKLSIEIIFLK